MKFKILITFCLALVFLLQISQVESLRKIHRTNNENSLPTNDTPQSPENKPATDQDIESDDEVSEEKIWYPPPYDGNNCVNMCKDICKINNLKYLFIISKKEGETLNCRCSKNPSDKNSPQSNVKSNRYNIIIRGDNGEILSCKHKVDK